MFYLIEVEDHIRVSPELFGLPTAEAVEKQLRNTYEGHYDKELGKVVSVVGMLDVGEGTIIPGDGAAYYRSRFKLVVWRPELHELVYGEVEEITNFGAFVDLGVMTGMVHISQTMEDFVSFNQAGDSLSGKSSSRILKKPDLCLARVVAVSHKGGDTKIGLTMRQPGLGKLEWIKEDKEKAKKEAEKLAKQQDKEAKSKKGKK